MMKNAAIARAPGPVRQKHERTLARFLDALSVKEGVSFKNLTVFPITLVAEDFKRSDEEFDVLGKPGSGLNARINDKPKLDFVEMKNSGKLRSVAFDGTIINGMTHGRIIGSSALVAPGEIVTLPACGIMYERRDYPPESELPPKRMFPLASHRRLIRIESLKRMTNEVPFMKQRRVWGKLETLFTDAGFSSPTMDVDDLYLHWNSAIEDYSWRYKTERNQIGIISFIEKDLWFIDLFLNTGLLEAAMPDLIKSYAFEALNRRMAIHEEAFRERIPEHEVAQETFDYLRCLNYRPMMFKGAAIRNSYYFDELNACGALLCDNDQLVYLVAYSKDKPPREY